MICPTFGPRDANRAAGVGDVSEVQRGEIVRLGGSMVTHLYLLHAVHIDPFETSVA